MTHEALDRWLQAEIAAFPCKTSLLMTDLDSGKTLHSIQAETRVVSASTIKVPILLYALEQVRKGKLTLAQAIPVPEERILPDTQVFERGIAAYPLRELLYWMIVESDNTATNVIIDLLGYEGMNEYIHDTLGMHDTDCQRNMLDWEAVKAGRNNFTSAQNQERMYRQLYQECILTEELRAAAMDFLTRQRSMDLFLRYIPDPITVAHKTGGLDYLDHDAGIFLLPSRRFFLGIFTWDGPSVEGDKRQRMFVGRLAKEIYDSYKDEGGKL